MTDDQYHNPDGAESVPPPASPRVADVTASPPVSEVPQLALRAIQVGAVAVILAVVAYHTFELDRFYVPKELVLHITGVTAGLAAMRALRHVRVTLTDILLTAFLLLGIISSIFAENGWFAVRALTITSSSLLLFWCARALRQAGRGSAVVAAIAAAVVVGCITSLLQTYGVTTDFFSINRAPGGTLGNRNSIAHMAAFGLPLLMMFALRARGVGSFIVAALGTAVVAAPLALTRSRAGYLAAAAAMAVMLFAMVAAPALRRSGRTWLRLAALLLVIAGSVAGALQIPNTLRWVGENPYLGSVRGVANFQEGSGRGRLVQYRQSLQITADHPLLGAGPGNWSVEYPDYAARRDPSLDPNAGGMTSNPWPSSDWVAFASERGVAALIMLLVALALLKWSALRRMRSAIDADDALTHATAIGVMAAAVVAGMFDAVLLLALPALLVWTALGALWVPDRFMNSGVTARRVVVAVAAFISAIGVVRSASQLTSIVVHSTSESNTMLQRAAFIDPSNYRLQVRLARRGSGLPRAERCEHAKAAVSLFPHATQAQSLARGCD